MAIPAWSRMTLQKDKAMATSEIMSRSRLTLCTGRIEQIGQYLYVRFLKRRLIPEDLCADLYEQIVKRLKGYRDRNPEVKKINKLFINNCVNWISKNLLKRQSRQERREKTVVELLKNEVQAFREPANKKLQTKYEKKILAVIKKQINSGKLKRRHLLYYVLYHAAETRLAFSVQLLKCAGLCTRQNIRRIKKIKTHIQKKTGTRSAVLMSIIEKKHTTIMDSQFALENSISRTEKKLHQEKLNKAKQARSIACEKLCKVRIVPSIRSLGKMLGPATSVISYGIRRVEAAIRIITKEAVK
jgi:hypothetical protein